MGRLVGSVIAGYVTMVIGVFILFSAAYMALGAPGVFRPGSWDPSLGWIVLSIVIGVVAAVAGGYVCAAIAKDPRGPKYLVGVVLVLGIVFALPVLTGGGEVATTARPDTVPMFDAMSNAKQPAWVALLNPILGVIGVLIGARLHKGQNA